MSNHPEQIDDDASPALMPVTTEWLALLLALLVRALPHCPEELQQEIRAALGGQ